jgi:hypothetical protein
MPEQNRELKNRVREIRSHGSVRGQGRNGLALLGNPPRPSCPDLKRVGTYRATPPREGILISDECTSFSVSPALTLDKTPISGQTKDTPAASALKYIVLRMRVKNAPAILVLAYPGEILGYGMWSTGMTIFRNSLYTRGNPIGKLSMVEWGLLALAGKSVYEARELAEKYGLQATGNFLISDSSGKSLSVESNAGGINFIPPEKGINVHANHAVGKKTMPFDDYPDKLEKTNSRYRMNCLWKLLNAERGRLTTQKALMCLADHSHGICRHKINDQADTCTTAAVVAEPGKGRLHVVRGNPCCNWPVSHEF